jgi:hypothetical protein
MKIGNKVICTLHPDWGAGVLSCISEGKGFIYWGEFGDMRDRKYEFCDLSLIKIVI